MEAEISITVFIHYILCRFLYMYYPVTPWESCAQIIYFLYLYPWVRQQFACSIMD